MNLLQPVFVLAAASPKLFTHSLLLAQSTNDYASRSREGSPIEGVLGLILLLLAIVSLWKIFTKADQPGWAAIIPIYNAYVLCQVAGKSGWWLLLLIIPVVNIVASFFLMLGLAGNFGKGALFAMGLFFLSFIFLPILAFSDAQYQGPASSRSYL